MEKKKRRAVSIAKKWWKYSPEYLAIGWAILVVFCMVGSLTGHGAAAAIAGCLIVVMWVLMRIMNEAITAFSVLARSKEDDDEEG